MTPNKEDREQATHTPTPWKICTYRPYRIIARDPKESTYQRGDNEFASVCIVEGSAWGSAPANAAYIVEAVNAHATLLAENKRMREALERLISGVAELSDSEIAMQHSGRVACEISYGDVKLARAALAKPEEAR